MISPSSIKKISVALLIAVISAAICAIDCVATPVRPIGKLKGGHRETLEDVHPPVIRAHRDIFDDIKPPVLPPAK